MGTKLKEVYPNLDVSLLPTYIRNNIDDIEVIGKRRRTLLLPNGQKYSLDNPLNDLTGSEWTFFTNSIINTKYSTQGEESYAHHIRKIHPSPKPPQLIKEIIRFFSKENEKVLDYFMGVGGTLIACSLTNRKGLGVELSEKFINAYKEACNYLELDEQKVFKGDSRNVLNNRDFEDVFSDEKAKLIVLDPPYFDMMSKKKTGHGMKKYGKNATPFTKETTDFGNMNEEIFWIELKSLVEDSMRFLKNKGHIVAFIKDMQPKEKKTNLLHSDMIETLNSIENLYYKGMKIWADQSSSLFPYGYPYSFVATQIHQYILIFQKRTQ